MHYIKNTEPGLWTVGHDDANGIWHPITDHGDIHEARHQCNFMNGGHHGATATFRELFDEMEVDAILDALERKRKHHEGQLKKMFEPFTWEQEEKYRAHQSAVTNCRSAIDTIINEVN